MKKMKPKKKKKHLLPPWEPNREDFVIRTKKKPSNLWWSIALEQEKTRSRANLESGSAYKHTCFGCGSGWDLDALRSPSGCNPLASWWSPALVLVGSWIWRVERFGLWNGGERRRGGLLLILMDWRGTGWELSDGWVDELKSARSLSHLPLFSLPLSISLTKALVDNKVGLAWLGVTYYH